MSRRAMIAREEVREMQWQINARTIRDCPGNRTENEWRAAIDALEKRLRGPERQCRTCKQSLHASHKYIVKETEDWLPSDSKLPRGRWPEEASAATLTAARKLKKFLGPRARIWIMVKREGNSCTYRMLKAA